MIQDQQAGDTFFVVEAKFTGQGLSYSRYEVKCRLGPWPHSGLLSRALGGYFGGSYQWLTLDTATFFSYTD